ncbi:hypothetical protein XF_1274 [Xylella fastidiosa 9a5c]|uniref:Uncharacterized protein n=1 Tax=Xylella fastidiosa (strain 9a5c) TaxID=160492 RepID=Q9PDV5_XYLFA|nr:hypothetical protein XF_1274 [Xylella fastidiosa 9a5c]
MVVIIAALLKSVIRNRILDTRFWIAFYYGICQVPCNALDGVFVAFSRAFWRGYAILCFDDVLLLGQQRMVLGMTPDLELF